VQCCDEAVDHGADVIAGDLLELAARFEHKRRPLVVAHEHVIADERRAGGQGTEL
jgi:hypothetical protein